MKEPLIFDCPNCNAPITVPDKIQQRIFQEIGIGIGGASVNIVKENRTIMLACPECGGSFGIDISKPKKPKGRSKWIYKQKMQGLG